MKGERAYQLLRGVGMALRARPELDDDEIVRMVRQALGLTPAPIPYENRISWAQRRRLRLEMLAAIEAGARCPYCGCRLADPRVPSRDDKERLRQAEWDHITPLCQGANSERGNLTLCCYGCNAHKGGRTPEQAGMRVPVPLAEGFVL
jgi:hypothetical protein